MESVLKLFQKYFHINSLFSFRIKNLLGKTIRKHSSYSLEIK